MGAHPTLSQMLALLDAAPTPTPAPEAPPAANMLIYVDAALSGMTASYQGSLYAGYPTIQEATAICPTGGTVRVRAGTYRGAADNDYACFALNRPMTLENYPGEQPVLTYPLDYGAGRYPVILRLEGHGMTAQGFRLIGTKTVGGSLERANLTIAHRGSQGEQGTLPTFIRNCLIEDNGLSAVLIDSALNPVTVEFLRITGGGFSAQEHGVYVAEAYNTTVRYCEISGMSGYGIHLYDPNSAIPTDCLVNSNLIHHNDFGLLLGGSSQRIYNNTIVDNLACQVQTWRGCKSIIARNNLIWHTDVVPVRGDWCKELPDNISDYDVINNNIGSIQDAENVWTPYLRATNLNVDPAFSPNYRLQPGSPMVNAGELLAGIRLLDPTVSTLPLVKASGDNTTIGACSL